MLSDIGCHRQAQLNGLPIIDIMSAKPLHIASDESLPTLSPATAPLIVFGCRARLSARHPCGADSAACGCGYIRGHFGDTVTWALAAAGTVYRWRLDPAASAAV